MTLLSPLLPPLLLLLFSSPLAALQLNAEGHGVSGEAARKEAFSALAEQLKVEVSSTFHAASDSSGRVDASRLITTHSELPLLGVDTEVSRSKSGYTCYAWLSSSKSSPLYQAEMKSLANRIRYQQQQLARESSGSSRYSLLNQLLTEIEQFENYRTVAQILGARSLPEIALTASTLRSQLLTLEAAAPTLAIATTVLARDLPQKRYFIYPPLPQGSSQATALSRQLRDSLRTRVTSLDQPQQAEILLKGGYEILKDGISVSYRAVNHQGVTLASRIVKLAPAAYQGMAYRPASPDFEQLLHHGYVVSNEFRAELSTNLGNSDLLFTPGQTIQLLVRLNHPGYYYLISHNTRDNISYLLQLNPGHHRRAFINFVNADQINRWLSLGEFEVTRPFGTENLQLIASSEDLLQRIPPTHYNESLQLHLVESHNRQEAVETTRGLVNVAFIQGRKVKAKNSEATLSFTTME
ncbi:MAG: DUF4384 domain-containing protein [Gammaproteobacteria bacterium]|nr:DUF4384 domain-containing protein [Gammaproteobacteria bacterium]